MLPFIVGSTDGGMVLRILIIVLVLILLATPITGWWLCQRALPVTDGVVTLEPLMHGAQIRFDERGIPYVEASSDRDLWLVEGYVHASDRMFQMDMLRRAARGQMSEVFGEQCLIDDKLMRSIGISQIADAELKKLSQDVRAFLDAYAMGVNEYLRRNVKTLPLEFATLAYRPDPWKPVDTLCVLKYLQFEGDESWRLDDLRQKILDTKGGEKLASEIFEEPLRSVINQPPTPIPPPKEEPVPATPAALPDATTPDAAQAAQGNEKGTAGTTGTAGRSTTGPETKTGTRTPREAAAGTRVTGTATTGARRSGFGTSTTRSESTPALRTAPSLPTQPAVNTAPSAPSNPEPTTAPEINYVPKTPLRPTQPTGFVPSLESYKKAMSRLASMDPRIGSNAFAIGGAMSDTHGSLLANDKHALYTVPDRFYQISLKSPSTHLVGATIPGVPGIMTGRNAFIAFGSANIKADTQDLILEEFSSQFPNKYRTAQGWQNVTENLEAIPVRLKKDLLHKVLVTKHGPILTRNETSGLALNWTGSRPLKPIIESLWKMNKAKDLVSFSLALDDYQGNPQTFVFADKKGAVGYKVAGAVPDRRRFGGGSVMVPGWLVRQDPPLMKAAELPQELISKEGFVISGEQRIPGHPSISSPYPPMRIRQVLTSFKRSGQRAGLPELGLLQTDQTAPLIELVKSELKRATDKTELIDKTQLTALEQLNNWSQRQYQLTPDSVPAAIYESFINTLAHRLLEPKLGSEATAEYLERWPRWTVLVERILRSHPNQWLPPGERSYDAFLISTFGMSLKGARVSAEKEDAKIVPWGSLHKATFRHPIGKYVSSLEKIAPIFDVGPVGVGGDQDTVNASNIKPSKDAWNFASSVGPTLRVLVDMADDEKLYANLALGESGQLISSYRSDQQKAWLKLEPHAMAVSDKQLERQTQHKLILTNQ
jgi:penicillin G amidase